MQGQISKGRVFVVGAGGHGKVVIDALSSAGDFEIVGVIDDDEEKLGRQVLGIPVVGLCAQLSSLAAKYRVDGAALAVGDNRAREQLFREVKRAGLPECIVPFPSLRGEGLGLGGNCYSPG